MKIKLDDVNFKDSIFGVPCIDGTYDLSWPQIEKLKSLGSKQFSIVKEECENCKKLSNQITELLLEIEKLKKVKK